MVAGVISCDMRFSKLPQCPLGTFSSSRDKDSTDLFIIIIAWQAQFYCHRLQCVIFPSEQKCPRCVNTHFLHVDPIEVWHEVVMVINDEYPPLLHCLLENKRSVKVFDESSYACFGMIEFCFSTKTTCILDPTRDHLCASGIVEHEGLKYIVYRPYLRLIT